MFYPNPKKRMMIMWKNFRVYYYQLIFVKENNRKIRGPVFPESRYDAINDVFEKMSSGKSITFRIRKKRIVIPKRVIARGHIIIRPSSYVRYWAQQLLFG